MNHPWEAEWLFLQRSGSRGVANASSPEMGYTATVGDTILSLLGACFMGTGTPKGSSSHEIPY